MAAARLVGKRRNNCMCGIVGYTGDQQAAPILLAGLEKLEYRGLRFSRSGSRDGERVPEVVKAKGRLRALAEDETMDAQCGATAVSVIPAGRHTGSRLRTMHIRTARMTAAW